MLYVLWMLFAVTMIAPDSDEAPATTDEVVALRAENKLLHSTIDRQAREIKKLEVRLDELQHRIDLLGITKEQLDAADRPAGKAGTTQSPAPAARTVFILDASGSMINVFGPAKEELVKAVHALRPADYYGVVVTQDQKATVFQPSLVPANLENFRKFAKFIDEASTTGTTDVVIGFEQAFKLHPSVVWLITDGDIGDKVVGRVGQVNRGACKINVMVMGKGAELSAVDLKAARDLAL